MSNKKNLKSEEIFAKALQNHKENNIKVAKKLYNATLKIDPYYVDAYNNLGILQNQLGEFEKAKSCYEKVIQIQPNNAAAYNNLGYTLKELGENQKAINCYEKAIKIQPNNVDALNNLGIILNKLQEYQKAIDCYEKAIKIQPNYIAAYYNLGNLFKDTGKHKNAVSYYEKSIQIQPNNAAALYNLGNTFFELNEYQQAISCYEKVIQISPNYIGVHNNLGNIYKELTDHKKAKSLYEKAIQIQPNNVDAYNNLGNLLKELGDHSNALSNYEKVIQIEPNNLSSHWLSMNLFPVIYKNLQEIDIFRKRFENSIKKINYLLDSQSKYTKKQLVNAIKSSTNFYLHYQGRDVLVLQQNYVYLIERITQKIYRKFHKDRKKNISSKYIKVGFISSFFRNHTVSKLFKNWALKLDQKYFKRFIYYADNKFDRVTNEIKQNVEHFFNHTDIDQLANRISQDNLDFLIYLDVGMIPKIQILSSLRLASIQCSTWGHPITSGFKNIDYFISSEIMETQNSQKYYSEKLINLPGLGIDYDFPNLSNIKKPDISIKSNTVIFLNLQSLFKLLPQDDHIYLDIVKKFPNCCFWFIQGLNNSVTNIFKRRISKIFKIEGFDFKEYSYFHPRCTQEEFFGLIEESDIILDSLNWSGGNTTLEAISLNKPVVTCPSSFMRGRHTYGILKTIGVGETIATSKKEYVEIAVKLANNINFRDSIVHKIKKNKQKLYNDEKPIRFLEDVIRKNVKI